MRMLSNKFSSVSGDVLLTSGFINFLSVLDKKHKDNCMEDWHHRIQSLGLHCSSEFKF